ncbi:hypothetical protein P9279_22010 [Mesorhizobium sp. WSM4962]|uniref:hypothetical protein n=1 Tax=Mesorhizobium sp. WSM4962 TaxID=3038548 RepID=UPI002417E0AF|nr:hypothetical protein [Mesorhizobium sp. WSM4962]MDG4903188.1 hypothetical protein [Mesorhizobium sp. WSM4962]
MNAIARRTLTPTPPPLHVALPGNLAAAVRELAELRGDHPQAMVAQLVRRVLDGDMAAGLLAPQEDAPEPEPVGQGRMAFQNVPGTLTELQCGVIYVLGFHADDDGVFRYLTTKIGIILGKGSQKHVAAILPVLVERGLVEEVTGKSRNRHWKLTWRGLSVFRELTEERE